MPFLFVYLHLMGSSQQQINSAAQVLESGEKPRPLDCRLGHRGHYRNETLGRCPKCKFWPRKWLPKLFLALQKHCTFIQSDLGLLDPKETFSATHTYYFWRRIRRKCDGNKSETWAEFPTTQPVSCCGRASLHVHHGTIWAQNLPAMQDWHILIGITEKLWMTLHSRMQPHFS